MRLIICCTLVATTAWASGKNPSGGGTGVGAVNPPGTAELRTFSEIAPAGGTVQMKLMLTQPHPISSGGADFAMSGMSVDGVALSSPLGDTAGVGLVHNDTLSVSVVSLGSDLGTALDYPFLTVTMDVPQTALAGAVLPLSPGSLAFSAPDGPITFINPKPGTLTVGGSLSVNGVWPGGGTWPAGTVITIRGTGFQSGTKLTTKMKVGAPTYVSPTEYRFTLQDVATLDQQPIVLTNPDRSTVTYYSYLRGVFVQRPTREFLRKAEPAFAARTQGIATIGPLPATGLGQFAAVAVQNPNPGPVMISFTLQSSGATTSIVLPSGGRVMDELSALLGGASIAAGDSVTVSATAGVQILGMNGDEIQGKLTPFLPVF